MVAEHDNVVLIAVDLKTKYAIIETIGGDENGPIIWLGANEHTLLEKGANRYGHTEIHFEEYPNWEVFSASMSKYTLNVTLTL